MRKILSLSPKFFHIVSSTIEARMSPNLVLKIESALVLEIEQKEDGEEEVKMREF